MPLDQADGDRETARKSGRRGSRVLKLTLLGGAVALLVREDLRTRLLNLLLGAEEEFDYSTLGDPPAPSDPPEVRSEPFVRSAPQEGAAEEHERAPEVAEPDEEPDWDDDTPDPVAVEPEPEPEPEVTVSDAKPGWDYTPRPTALEDEPDWAQADSPPAADPVPASSFDYTPPRAKVESEPDWGQAQTARYEHEPESDTDAQSGEPEEQLESVDAGPPLAEVSPPVDETPRAPGSIAPSPAAWRAAAVAHEQGVRDEQEDAPDTDDSSAEPPAPPVGWWQPTRPGIEPR